MTRFRVSDTSISGVQLVERRQIDDSRGSLTRVFCADELMAVGWHNPIAQINLTRTINAGTLRGLHFQRRPSLEMKLVMCLEGRIFDVVVDLRRGSPTFLSHQHAILTAENNQAFLIPEGCAHGFQTLTDNVVLLYLHSAPHDNTAECGLSAFDTRLAIEWPLAVTEMSDRDRSLQTISPEFQGLEL